MTVHDPPLPLRKKALFIAILIAMSLFVTVGGLEVALRIIDGLKRATSRGQLDYGETWRTGGLGPGGYLKENFRGQVQDGFGNAVWWANNSQGFRSDREFDREPPSGVLRILSLGDSFTAGYGVEQGATYSDLIEEWISSKYVPCEVLISCTESPEEALRYLKTEGEKWHPHLVLLGITLGNDIAEDYISRNPDKIGFEHGLEKLDLPPSSLKARSLGNKLGRFFQQHSRLVQRFFPARRGIVSWYGKAAVPKLFDPCHGLGIFLKNAPPEIEEAYRRHFRVLADFKEYCRSNGMEFAVLIFPQRFQIQAEDWRATVKQYSLREEAFDLGLPNRRHRDFCASEGISLIDPTEKMKAEHERTRAELYFPKGDMHWNKSGHALWFSGAREFLRPMVEKVIEQKGIRRGQDKTGVIRENRGTAFKFALYGRRYLREVFKKLHYLFEAFDLPIPIALYLLKYRDLDMDGYDIVYFLEGKKRILG
jgi:hypothetical protein